MLPAVEIARRKQYAGMRLFTLALAAATALATNNDMLVQSIGKLQNLFMGLELVPNSNFTAEDLLKIEARLANPQALQALVMHEAAAFNLTDLSRSEEEAQAGLLSLIDRSRAIFEARLRSTVANRTDPAEIEATKNDMRTILASLKRMDLGRAEAWIADFYTRHPYAINLLQVYYRSNATLFNRDVLGYLRLFSIVAYEYDPELADKLVAMTAIVQAKHHVFSDEYYAKVLAALAGGATYPNEG